MARILFVLNSLAGGGTERSTVILAQELVERGHEAHVVCLHDAGAEASSWAAERGVVPTLLAGRTPLGWIREIRSLIDIERPDVVHTALFQSDIAGRFAARASRTPVIASIVNTTYDRERLRDPSVSALRLVPSWIGERTTWRMVTQFHSVSEGCAEHVHRTLRIPRSRITVVERGRDLSVLGANTPERRAAVRTELGIGADERVALSLGRLDWQKGHADLVRAAELLGADSPWRFLIAGKDGNAGDELRSSIAASPTGDRVRLLGESADVGGLLCAADVFVLPSRYEGTAGVVIEAMAVGAPILSVDLEGLHGILAHEENALLYPGRDVDALVAGLRRLGGDGDLRERLVENGRRAFDAGFTTGDYVDGMIELYASVTRR